MVVPDYLTADSLQFSATKKSSLVWLVCRTDFRNGMGSKRDGLINATGPKIWIPWFELVLCSSVNCFNTYSIIMSFVDCPTWQLDYFRNSVTQEACKSAVLHDHKQTGREWNRIMSCNIGIFWFTRGPPNCSCFICLRVIDYNQKLKYAIAQTTSGFV